jgi:hypothetical protein
MGVVKIRPFRVIVSDLASFTASEAFGAEGRLFEADVFGFGLSVLNA